MADDVLFQITKEHLETGLRGFPCGYCTTSHVDPQKGLFYVGKPIADLVSHSAEEVIYLLYFGHIGSEKQIKTFFQELQKRATLSEAVIQDIEKLPKIGHPMQLFSAALLIAGMYEAKNDYKEDCLNLIAKLPHLVAAVINYHAGWGPTPQPQSHLGYIENFVYMLRVPGGNRAQLMEAFHLFFILHLDHGGGNLSTFVGKAVASGLDDLYGSICSAMCALAGPRHGKANQDCLEFVQSMIAEVGANATENQVEQAIRHRLDTGLLVFGFGHAVLRVEDPRATVQYDYVQKHFADHPLVKMALLLRKAGVKVLSENPKITCPYPNVDAVSGSMLTAAGFTYPVYYTVLFGMSRSIGISIQIVYERILARSGKGTPIVRPKYLFKERE
ncbi:MAG: citrate (Si)-synthase [Chlamydiae bacterium]|nr:citrate (Si)-synthase [Chlamydiota bacterium]